MIKKPSASEKDTRTQSRYDSRRTSRSDLIPSVRQSEWEDSGRRTGTSKYRRSRKSEISTEQLENLDVNNQKNQTSVETIVIPKSPGRPKTSEKLRKENKILLSLNDEDYEELMRLQKILGKKTLTSTVEYFLQLGITKMREDFLSASEKNSECALRGKGF